MTLFLITSFGCRNTAKDEPVTEEVVQNVDGDGDGFTEDVDCDDTNADINSNAEELCDDIDNNCDGQIDEGVKQLFYADGDGDGYGETDEGRKWKNKRKINIRILKLEPKLN